MLMRNHVVTATFGGIILMLAISAAMLSQLEPAWWVLLTGGSMLTYAFLLPVMEGIPSKKRTLNATRHVQKRKIKRGELVYIEVDVSNSTRSSYPVVRVTDQVPDDMVCVNGSNSHVCSIGPYGHATFGYVLKSVKRGMFPIGPVKVDVASSSGGCLEEVVCGQTDSILVVPGGEWDPSKMKHMKRKIQVGESVSHLKGSGFDYLGSRKYAEGDELKLIDWNMFAKTGELGTREFAVERGETVALVIDTHPTMNQGYKEISKLDSSVEACTIIGEEMLRRGYKVIIATGSGDGEIRSFTSKERREMFEHLALVSARKASDVGQSMARLLKEAPRTRRLLVFTDMENARTLIPVARRNRRKDLTVVVPLLPKLTLSEEKQSRAEREFMEELISALYVYESSLNWLRLSHVKRTSCKVVSAPLEDLPKVCMRSGVIA